MAFKTELMRGKEMKLYLKNVPYGRDTSQRLDIVYKGGNNVHAVVYIHGGAYFTGNKDEYPMFLTDYSENYLFASINYRVINTENTIHMGSILSDVIGALKKIQEFSKGITIKDFILDGNFPDSICVKERENSPDAACSRYK
jgi:acetyl esterase/lipase